MWRKIASAGLLLTALASFAQFEAENDQAVVKAVIASYEAALGSSSVDLVLDTYHDNGTFLLYGHEPMKWKAALREFYTGFFNAVSPRIEMQINDIETSGDLAYVTSVSKGKVKILDEGIEVNGAGQELFVLKKVNAKDWKIVAYHASSRSAGS